MRIQLLAAAAVASLAFAVAPAGAAPAAPQITDAAGDVFPAAGAGADVVSARFSTLGTTAKVGRKTVYTPNKLVVTMTYAGDVPAGANITQIVSFEAPGCGGVYLQSFDSGVWGFADCIEGDFPFMVKPAGKTLTFTLPFKTLGSGALKKGAKLSALRTYTTYADPAFGYEPVELTDVPTTATDDATTTATYTIA